jgi:hypothetical protein
MWGLWSRTRADWFTRNGEIVTWTRRVEAQFMAKAISGYVVKEMKMTVHECCICGGDIAGHGHNPSPLASKGRVCNECDESVLKARVASLRGASWR